MMENNYAVIMAGGVGSRFWPMSKKTFPKQFHDMLGTGYSLLQQTFQRLQKQVPAKNILILTNEDYVSLVHQQLPEVSVDNIVAEPAMRNTAPCILLAALKIQKKNPDAVMIVAPSDHLIADEDAFSKAVETSFAFCQNNKQALMTLGIEPDSPNTGFGYTEYNQDDTGEIKTVERFLEKPDLDRAKQFVDAGNFLWNAGIFIWSVEAVVSAFAKAKPNLYNLFSNGRKHLNTSEESDFLQEHYPKAENISVDYAIMENSDQVYVLPVDFGWNDLGTWGSLHGRLPKDEGDNAVVNADLLSRKSSGHLVHLESKKKVIIGNIDDLIVVERDGVLMILPRSAEQEIKQVREEAMKKYGEHIG